MWGDRGRRRLGKEEDGLMEGLPEADGEGSRGDALDAERRRGGMRGACGLSYRKEKG